LTHIALVIPGLDRIGGAERQTILLAKGFRKRGNRVSVVALSGTGGAAARELTEAGVAFLTLKMRKGLADARGWLRFQCWLWRERPDVVHAHLAHAVWLTRWSRLTAPVPVQVDTLHSASTGTLGRRFGYRLSNWLTDRVTAVSQEVAEAHLRAGMVSRGKLVIVHNGVDIGVWRPDSEKRAGVRKEMGFKDEFVWLATGRLEPVKDHASLLRALARLPETAQLMVAGWGTLFAGLQALTTELRLTTRVQFLGFVPDLERWMHAADGFVLSSRWEGLPTGLIEAAASGLPSVATDVAGVREIVAEGQSGLLTPVGDVEALAAAMEQVMQMPLEMRRAMGNLARQRAGGQFSLDAVLDAWERLYGTLLDEKRRAYSYRSASAGRMRAAADDGYNVASREIPIETTETMTPSRGRVAKGSVSIE